MIYTFTKQDVGRYLRYRESGNVYRVIVLGDGIPIIRSSTGLLTCVRFDECEWVDVTPVEEVLVGGKPPPDEQRTYHVIRAPIAGSGHWYYATNKQGKIGATRFLECATFYPSSNDASLRLRESVRGQFPDHEWSLAQVTMEVRPIVDHAALRRSALAKLTAAERAALGLEGDCAP